MIKAVENVFFLNLSKQVTNHKGKANKHKNIKIPAKPNIRKNTISNIVEIAILFNRSRYFYHFFFVKVAINTSMEPDQ